MEQQQKFEDTIPALKGIIWHTDSNETVNL